MTGTIIAGIVIGVVVGIAILCCLVGTVVDCFVHIYKYWCSCLHKAYHYQTEMTTFRSPRQSPTEPAHLVVRALPPSYSAITLRCDSPETDNQQEQQHQQSSSPTTASASRDTSTARRFDFEHTGVASELKLHDNRHYYYVKRMKVSPKEMPPSYSSLYLRDETGDEDRVLLNMAAYERQSLLRHHSPEEERRNIILALQPTASPSIYTGRRQDNYYSSRAGNSRNYWDMSPT